MSFRLTREAQADVEEVYRYSYEHFGELQADTYHDGLSECFALLADSPLLGRDYSALRTGIRRHG
jgi:toxin ParE1/3/4